MTASERGELAFAALNELEVALFGDNLLRSRDELTERAEALVGGLRAIAELQPRMLATLQKHGVVFDGPLGADPKNFQHVAFSIYTTLCEADSIAAAALSTEDNG